MSEFGPERLSPEAVRLYMATHAHYRHMMGEFAAAFEGTPEYDQAIAGFTEGMYYFELEETAIQLPYELQGATALKPLFLDQTETMYILGARLYRGDNAHYVPQVFENPDAHGRATHNVYIVMPTEGQPFVINGWDAEPTKRPEAPEDSWVDPAGYVQALRDVGLQPAYLTDDECISLQHTVQRMHLNHTATRLEHGFPEAEE